MTYARTLFSLALGLTAAGCAVHQSASPSLAAPDLPKVYQPNVTTSEVPPPISIGKVVLTRTEEAVPPPSAEDIRLQMKQAADRAAQEARDAAAAEISRLSSQTNQLLSQTTEVLRANNAAQQQTEQLKNLALQQNQQQLNLISARVSATLAQVSRQSVKPEQAQAIAQQAVEQAAPQFRALALQSVKDSQDYIRTVARTAVQSDDPEMKAAFTNAARDVITKDDRIVFAIRKVVGDELAAAKPSGNTDVAMNSMLGASAVQPLGANPTVAEAELAGISPAAGSPDTSITIPLSMRAQWMDLRKYRVVVHEDGKTLEEMMSTVLSRAAPFTGPWHIKWKISDENKDILQERFSLDVETSFDEFVSYLAQYMVNDRGIKITFSLFDADRIIVVSD